MVGKVHIERASGRVATFIATLPLGRTHSPDDRTPTHGPDATVLAAADACAEKAESGQLQNEAVTLNAMIDDDAPADTTSPYTAPSPCVAGPRVLVAEDNADMRLHLGRILGNDGFEVLSVADGDAALAVARQQKPDLVLTAVMLPRLDGIGLLAALRKDPDLRDVPVVVLSTPGSEEARTACLRAGADDYLVKPFSARDLLTRVGSHLALSNLRAAEMAAMSRLHALSCRLTAISDLPSLLHEVLRSTIELQGADFGTIQLYDSETRSLHIAAQQGFGTEFLEHFRKVTVDEGSACARALKEGTRVVIVDVTLDPEFAPHRHIAAAAGFRAVQSTPLIDRGSGQAVGMLSTHFRDPHRLDPRDLRSTDLYALQAGDVIALRVTEQRLRESEAQLQAAADLVGLSPYSWNPQTDALAWNAHIKAMWGLPPDAHVDHAVFLAGIHPDDRPHVEAAVARTIDPAGDGLYRAEYRVIGIGDCVERWISAHGRTFFDNGKPVRHVGAARDITDQKRAEERAHESEERLRAAMVASGTGTWRWNIRTDAAECDEALDRLLGVPPGKAVRNLNDFLMLIHPEDRAEFARRVDRSAREGTDFEMEYRLLRSDGHLFWFYARGKTFCDANGRPSYMTGACLDITGWKHAQEVLRESEERFRKFAEHSTDVLRIVDLGTLLHVFISPAFDRVWGSPIDRIRDTRDWIDTVHPADRERVIDAFERVQRGEDLGLEYRILRPDGGVRRIHDTMFAIRDEHGRVGRVGGSAQDITHYSGSLVYLVDADPTSRLEVAEMLQGAGYDVKTFTSARTFLRLAPVLVPGCVVVDIRRAEAGDLAIPRELRARRRELPVIIVGDSTRDLRLGVRAMKAGATDFLPTPYRREDLLTAIATELADIQEVTARDREAELAKASVAVMSLRERQVLDGMLAGGTSKSIARELGISPRTVEMHRAHVMERLGARTLSELILLATAAGLRPSRIAREAGSDAVGTSAETIFPRG
jgi:PAS domain S-box-containing protein